jgi:hypothetical protein
MKIVQQINQQRYDLGIRSGASTGGGPNTRIVVP